MVTERALGEGGLRESVDRLRARLADRRVGDPLVSLGEVLNWLYALEEFHATPDRKMYYAARDASPDGSVLAGLIYARGLVTHQLAALGSLVFRPGSITRGGLVGGRRGGSDMTIRPPSASMQWKPLSALPTPPSWAVKKGRDIKYRDLVENRGLLEPIEAAVRYLLSLP